MGRAANGGQHGTEEAAKLFPMVEVKKELSTPSVGCLEVHITGPSMRRCKVWPPFCLLEAYVGGDRVQWKMLPMERETRKREEKEIEGWKMHLRIPVGLDWPSLSLDLVVKRLDYVPSWEAGDLHLIRGGPHSSRYDAVIGRARVKLMDALILGDEDEDEEGEDRKRRKRENADPRCIPRMERTLVFEKRVTLEDWVAPSPDRAPHFVSRGTVHVLMAMFELV